MGLARDVAQILSLYLPFKTNPELIDDVQGAFRSFKQNLLASSGLTRRGDIRVTFHFGKERVANVPWVAFFYEIEKEDALKDLCCMFLFKADMSGVYLTVNQGVGSFAERIPTVKHLEDLEKMATDLRKEFSSLSRYGFQLDANIDLSDISATGRAYEKSTIVHKYYGRGQLPSDWGFEKDIGAVLEAYDNSVNNSSCSSANTTASALAPETSLVNEPPMDEAEKGSYQTLFAQLDFEKAKDEFHSLKPPEMKKVRDIICFAENEWQLPSFQRYFDWKEDDVRSFLESVFNDYYVGSFLLWEKTRNIEPDLELINIDGVIKTIGDPDAIILDGQQRITSLYWAIKGPNIGSKPEKVPHVYFYVDFKSFFASIAEDETEVQKGDAIVCLNTKYTNEETYKKMLFPLYELENFGDWIDGFEDYYRDQLRYSDTQVRHVRRIMEKRLKHMWEGFEIPCVFLPASMTLKQVADIFEQLNTKGKILGIFDLLMARLLKYHIPLRSYWNDCKDNFPDTILRYEKFKKSERIPVYIIQAMSLYYDKKAHSCKREDILDIYKRIYKNPSFSFKEHWEDSSSHMDRAIKLFENPVSGYGVKDEKEVPSITMVTMSSALLKEIDARSDKDRCFRKMDMWYWASVFTNAYSGSVDSTMSAHYKELLSWFDDESQVPGVVNQARREVDSMDLTKIRQHGNVVYKGILSLLMLEHAKDFAEKKEVGHAPSYQKHHIFPKGCPVSGPAYLIDSILNITWLTKGTNQRITKAKQPSTYLEELLAEKYDGNVEELLEVLKTHFIDRTAYEYMLKDSEGFEQFLKHRQELIKEKIRENLGIKSVGKEPALIKPGDPWGNKLAYEDAISNCSGKIQWFDRWFSVQGFTFLSHAVNKEKVSEIKILAGVYSQIGKPAIDVMKELRENFKEFQAYMKSKGVKTELRILVPSLRSASHDRWLFSSTKSYRLPSPDTVSRGQYSEISQTAIRLPFDESWLQSKDIINEWNTIRDMAEKQDQNKASS